MNNKVITRPPIGFIVEGTGEYHSFPSLVNRILDVSNMYVPISNARGYGKIILDLPREIRMIIRRAHPYSLYVCLDLIDILKENIVSNCLELITLLTSQIDSFTNSNDPQCHPLPNSYGVILQIPQFETWMIADITSLIDSGLIDNIHAPIIDVDNTVDKPYKWLRCNLLDRHMNPKKPNIAKDILSVLEPNSMRSNSRSFEKFYREVTDAYSLWETACEQAQ